MNSILQIPQGNRSGFTLVEIMIVVMILGILAAMAAPSYKKSTESAQKNGCINNLRVLNNAKEQWAMEHKRLNGDPVVELEVDEHIKKGRPLCPSDGDYTYGVVGADPICSLGATYKHTL